MVFSKDQIEEIVESFVELRDALYVRIGEVESANQCASRIIAAEIGRYGSSGLVTDTEVK